MKTKAKIPVLLVCFGLALGACTGLQQFPSTSTNYVDDLKSQSSFNKGLS